MSKDMNDVITGLERKGRIAAYLLYFTTLATVIAIIGSCIVLKQEHNELILLIDQAVAGTPSLVETTGTQ